MNAGIDRRSRSVAGARGCSLSVVEGGAPDGPPLLFIHGLSQAKLAWQRQFSGMLAERFRLVAFDLRGHGHSDRPAAGYDESEVWAEDVHRVIEAMSLARPVVVAWSYGGLVACDYLRLHGTSSIAGLVLVGPATRIGVPGAISDVPAGTLDDDLTATDGEHSVAALGRFVGTLARRPMPASEHAFFLGFNVMTPARVRAALLARTLDNDDVLSGLDVPVLVVQGGCDHQIVPAAARRVARLTARAEYRLYDRSGHTPFWEEPERFDADVAAFAEGVADARRW